MLTLLIFSLSCSRFVAPMILLVKKSREFTKASAISDGEKLFFLAKSLNFSEYIKPFGFVYLVNMSPNKVNLAPSGFDPLSYFPLSIPKPRGEYARSPHFSRIETSASPTS